MKKYSLVVVLILVLVACQKFAQPDPKGGSSEYDEDESHETGNNCMDCHYSAGYAEGIFTVAGSSFGNTDNADILIYDSEFDVILKTIQVDSRGNFYTPDDLDFSEGLYAGTRNAQGDLELMEDPIFHGQCNLCHGTSIEGRLTIE